MRRSYDIVMKKGQYGANGSAAQAHIRVMNHVQQPMTSKNNDTHGYLDTMTDNDDSQSKPQSRGYQPEKFTMKNLRQAKAALPVNDNSDDDIDDMPFISSK